MRDGHHVVASVAVDLLQSGWSCFIRLRRPEEVEGVGSKVNERALLGSRAVLEHNSAEVDRAVRGKHLVSFGLPLHESRSSKLEPACSTDVVDDLQSTLDLQSEVRLKGGEREWSEAQWSAAVRLGSSPLGLIVCKPVAYTVDVHAIGVGLDMMKVSISPRLSTNGEEVVNEEEEGPSLHAEPLSLKDAVLVARNSSNRGLAVGMNV